MIIVMRRDRVECQPCLLQLSAVHACRCHCQVKDFYHGGSLNTLEGHIPPGDVIRRHSPLPARGTCQRQRCGLTGYERLHLHSVSHRVNIGVRGLHAFVRDNVSPLGHFNPAILCQLCVRAHANRQHDQVCLQFLTAACLNLQSSISVDFLDGFQTIPQYQLDAMQCQVLMHLHCHFIVHRCHHLVEHFHDGDFNSSFRQVFSDFQTDEPTADHNSSFYLLCPDISIQSVEFGNVVQYEHPLQVHAWQRWHDRLCSGRKYQLVVFFRVLPATGMFSYQDSFCFPVDCHYLVVWARVNIEHFFEALGCRDHQFFPLVNGPAQVVWQSTIRERHIRSFLQHHDLCLFIHTPQSRRRACPTCHSAYDHYLHLCLLRHDSQDCLCLIQVAFKLPCQDPA